jgi:hypothetical protein
VSTFEEMTPSPLKQGALTENASGLGTVSRGMVRERAVELAVINGRVAGETSPADWEQAKRELTGGSELDPKQALLESADESERWNPVPGSIGHQAKESGSEDEDSDGRSDAARLVEQGVEEAEHDQMLQAARAQQEEDGQ